MSLARLGQVDELGALRRLDDEARKLERVATGPSVEELIAQERERSYSYGGRSVSAGNRRRPWRTLSTQRGRWRG
jgi:hypothetical protein